MAPPPDSHCTHGRRWFVNLKEDRQGLPRLPSAATRIKGKPKLGKASNPIPVMSTSPPIRQTRASKKRINSKAIISDDDMDGVPNPTATTAAITAIILDGSEDDAAPLKEKPRPKKGPTKKGAERPKPRLMKRQVGGGEPDISEGESGNEFEEIPGTGTLGGKTLTQALQEGPFRGTKPKHSISVPEVLITSNPASILQGSVISPSPTPRAPSKVASVPILSRAASTTPSIPILSRAASIAPTPIVPAPSKVLTKGPSKRVGGLETDVFGPIPASKRPRVQEGGEEVRLATNMEVEILTDAQSQGSTLAPQPPHARPPSVQPAGATPADMGYGLPPPLQMHSRPPSVQPAGTTPADMGYGPPLLLRMNSRPPSTQLAGATPVDMGYGPPPPLRINSRPPSTQPASVPDGTNHHVDTPADPHSRGPTPTLQPPHGPPHGPPPPLKMNSRPPSVPPMGIPYGTDHHPGYAQHQWGPMMQQGFMQMQPGQSMYQGPPMQQGPYANHMYPGATWPGPPPPNAAYSGWPAPVTQNATTTTGVPPTAYGAWPSAPLAAHGPTAAAPYGNWTAPLAPHIGTPYGTWPAAHDGHASLAPPASSDVAPLDEGEPLGASTQSSTM